MKRRTFYRNTAFLATLPVSLTFCGVKKTEKANQTNTILEKVKTAMLCMQCGS